MGSRMDGAPAAGLGSVILRLGIFLVIAADLSGCAFLARSERVKPPPPIPGIDRVRSMTVLPVRFVLKHTPFSKPEPESTAMSLHRETVSLLKVEIERLVSRTRFGLRRLDTEDSTLLRKPWLFSLVSAHLEQPDRALLRAIASPDRALMCPMDIVDFVVDSTGSQYLLFVQGSGSYSTGPTWKYSDEKAPGYSGSLLRDVAKAILGVHSSDLEESAVETDFYLKAQLVDVADRQILWHNSVRFEKRLEQQRGLFAPPFFDLRKGKDLRAACEQLMAPLLEGQPPR